MKGSVRIRLARFGRKFAPVYNVVVARARSGRNKLPIEVIGTYNPIPAPLTAEQRKAGAKPVKEVHLDLNRSKYWLGVGAQPTDPVARLFRKFGLLDPVWPSPLKGPKIPERDVVSVTQLASAFEQDVAGAREQKEAAEAATAQN